MDNPVQISDVEARYRPLAGPERDVATTWVGDAWAILLAQVPGLVQRVQSGAVTGTLIKATVSAMVIRVLRNPDAIKQFGADQASYTRDTAVSSGTLYVSDAEIALLGGTTAEPVGHLSFSGAYGWHPSHVPDAWGWR